MLCRRAFFSPFRKVVRPSYYLPSAPVRTYKIRAELESQLDPAYPSLQQHAWGQEAPKLVLTPEDTGLAPGFPLKEDKDLWNSGPDELISERAELWWDDGTAVPEWFVDNTWPVSNNMALAQLVGFIGFLFAAFMTPAYLVGDSLRKCVPQEEILPFNVLNDAKYNHIDASLNLITFKKEAKSEGGEEEEEEDEEDED